MTGDLNWNITRALMTADLTCAGCRAAAGRSDSLLEVRPVIGVLVGVVGALVLLAIAIVVAMRVRGITDAKVNGPGPQGSPAH